MQRYPLERGGKRHTDINANTLSSFGFVEFTNGHYFAILFLFIIIISPRKLMQNERKVISAADKEGSAAQGVSDPVRQPRGGRVGGHLSGHQVRSHSID